MDTTEAARQTVLALRVMTNPDQYQKPWELAKINLELALAAISNAAPPAPADSGGLLPLDPVRLKAAIEAGYDADGCGPGSSAVPAALGDDIDDKALKAAIDYWQEMNDHGEYSRDRNVRGTIRAYLKAAPPAPPAASHSHAAETIATLLDPVVEFCRDRGRADLSARCIAARTVAPAPPAAGVSEATNETTESLLKQADIAAAGLERDGVSYGAFIMGRLAAKVRELQGDVTAAAGELRVPIPEPGTDMARLLIANVLLRRERTNAPGQAGSTYE